MSSSGGSDLSSLSSSCALSTGPSESDAFFVPNPHVARAAAAAWRADATTLSSPSPGDGGGRADNFADVAIGCHEADDDSGLVFVAMWPPPLDILSTPYSSFLKRIRRCFDSADLPTDETRQPGVDDALAPVYLYPENCLHVTIATLHPFTVPVRDVSKREILVEKWTEVLRGATKRPGCPAADGKLRLQLKVKGAQIGSKAGILMWEECDGSTMDAMRQCIRDETLHRASELTKAGIDPSTLFLPNIIHSTFLRFSSMPSIRLAEAQRRFDEMVRPEMDEIWGDIVVDLDLGRLVRERKPYMHIPCDERHVVETVR